MREATLLNIGDTIDYGTYVGHEGTTGNSTGIHLHLMQQDMTNTDTWVFGLPISELKNPADYLGIPNTQGISAIYNGTPIFDITIKNKFPWAILTRKIRNKRTFF